MHIYADDALCFSGLDCFLPFLLSKAFVGHNLENADFVSKSDKP
jgi:hypothetical protein